MEIHQDHRRTLYDYADGSFKSAKAMIFAEDAIVGDHVHENKDEEFLLLRGCFLELIVGDKTIKNIIAPHKVNINRGVYHKFLCRKDSILLCVSTEQYNKNDEIK